MNIEKSPQQKALDLFDTWVELPESERIERLRSLQQSDVALAAALADLLRADAAASGVLDRGVQAIVADVVEANSVTTPDTPAQIGAFALLRPLGRGGMGEVWLGERRDGAFVQQVALKLLKRGMDSDAVIARFVQERRILAELNHPHIARFIDGGISADGRPYFAMEYVAGENLIDHAKAQQLGVRERVRLLAMVCDAVAYAQAHLVVHRDLKPSNILIDDNGQPRVLDFGIAKLLGDSAPEEAMTQTGARALSPHYAAPEQVLGESISTATDVYALGTILFELLTGALPQQRQALSLEALAAQVKTEQAPAPSDVLKRGIGLAQGTGTTLGMHTARLAREVTGDLDTIVLTALQREPARRYANAAALAEDLRRWLDARPIAAQADTHGYRLRKFVARNRFAVGGAMAVLLALLAGLTLALWQASIARQQALRAQAEAQRAERSRSFLLSVFKSADQTQLRGEALTAREILASARARVAVAFEDDPIGRASMQLALADIYAGAGNLPAAEELTRSAAQTWHAFPLAEPALQARTELLLATIVYELKGPDAARPLAERAVLQLRALGASEREYLAKALIELAFCTQDGDRAVALVDEALAVMAARFGADSGEYASALVNRATILEDAGEYAQARKDYESALPVVIATRGELHPKTAHARITLAGLLDRLGEHERARQQFELGIASMRKLYDNRGEALAAALFSQGIFFTSIGDFATSVANFQEVITLAEPLSVQNAHAHRYLGNAQFSLDRLTEAREALNTALNIYLGTLGKSDAQYWRAEADLGWVESAIGDQRAALERQTFAVRKLEEILGPERSELIRPLRGLAQTQAKLGQFAPAQASYERALQLSDKHLGKVSAISCGIQTGMAQLALQARWSERMPALRKALENCHGRLMQSSPRPEATLKDIVGLLQRTD